MLLSHGATVTALKIYGLEKLQFGVQMFKATSGASDYKGGPALVQLSIFLCFANFHECILLVFYCY